MRVDQVQLFKCEYGTRCDTFGCGESAVHFVGRPDAPFNTNYILCQKCSDELVESIGEGVEVVTHENVVIKVDEYEDLKIKAAAWDEYAKNVTTFIVSDGENTSTITSNDGGFRLEGPNITLTGDDINAMNGEVFESAGVPSDVLTDGRIISGVINTNELEEDEEGFDIDTMLEDARTHADLDKIVELIGVTNVPPKEDENGKHTMDERKEAILANFEDAE